MMEHSEAQRSIEARIGKPHGCGILANHSDILSTHPFGQRTGESSIDFDACKSLKARVKKLGGDSGAGPDLQNIRPQIEALQYPWNNVGFHCRFPCLRTAQIAVG